MGYRSEVCLRINKTAITKEQWAEVEKHWSDEVEEVKGYYHFHTCDVKWYEDSGYKHVDVVMDLILDLGNEDYGMLRVGDDAGDIEEYGCPYYFNIFASTTINYH